MPGRDVLSSLSFVMTSMSMAAVLRSPSQTGCFLFVLYMIWIFLVLDVICLIVYNRQTLLEIGSTVTHSKPDFKFLNTDVYNQHCNMHFKNRFVALLSFWLDAFNEVKCWQSAGTPPGLHRFPSHANIIKNHLLLFLFSVLLLSLTCMQC